MADNEDEIFEKEDPKVKLVKEKKPISTERLEKLRNQLVLAREARLAKKNKNKEEVAVVKEEPVSVKEEPVKEEVKEEVKEKVKEKVKKEIAPKKKRVNKTEMLLNELNSLKLEIKELKSKPAVAKSTPPKKDAILPVAKSAPIAIPKPTAVVYKPIPYSLLKTPMW